MGGQQSVGHGYLQAVAGGLEIGEDDRGTEADLVHRARLCLSHW